MENEKRLIDANALRTDSMAKCGVGEFAFKNCYPYWVFDKAIENAPTVDAVEVVRCKDCWKSADGLCSYQLKNVPGKDFCGDGERKDNG
jgi:hypothetical protein